MQFERLGGKLTIARIGEIENKIGAGLIEEVIQVAEGELKLADVLLQSKVYVSFPLDSVEA
jgi:NADH dehydrogenase (ubiquinone) 1 alpha subcomplex subunit 5